MSRLKALLKGRNSFRALTLALLVSGHAYAADYYGYSYKEFDVVAAGSKEYAATLARNLDAMDEALTLLINLDKNVPRPRTQIYALPSREMEALARSNTVAAIFLPGQFVNVVLTRNGSWDGNDYFGAYFGFVSGLMNSLGMARYPAWYKRGVASVFAVSSVKEFTLTTGGIHYGYADYLARGPLIPMRKFLTSGADDPEFNKTEFQKGKYAAQCWWFVHLSLLDGLLSKETGEFVQRVVKGEDVDAAFNASFSMSYEDLDKILQAKFHKQQMRAYSVSMLDVADRVQIRKLSSVEVNTTLALVALRRGMPDMAASYARQALATDAANERATLFLALAAARSKPVEGLAIADALSTRASLDQETHAALGELYGLLHSSGQPLGQSTNELNSKAVAQLREAIAMDPSDSESVAMLAYAVRDSGDMAIVAALLPIVEQAYYQRSNSSALAGAAAMLNDFLGRKQDAFKFVVAQERLAMTEFERSNASDMRKRLLAEIQAASQLVAPTR